ncbi:hypothetical protein FPV67DRAFT_1669368 [Lyophyllum atratum]|nr:hypothetical protein FPV67DRAFT_1669368 [Lyophyllum atratum]
MPNGSDPLTVTRIRQAAREAIWVLEIHNFKACLFGSAACAIYGMENREPNVRAYHLSYQKTTVDEEDMDKLLEMAVYEYGARLDNNEWMPGWFAQEAEERVEQQNKAWPDSAEYWSELGLCTW